MSQKILRRQGRPDQRAQAAAQEQGNHSALGDVVHAAIACAVKAEAAELARPIYVNQKTVFDVLSMPGVRFLEVARAEPPGFPSFKEQRLIYAKTADVAAYIELHPARRDERPVDRESETFARLGIRRIA